MKKFMYFTSIIMLVLCISISFAWMIDVTAPSGLFPSFNFDKTIYVASNDVTIDLQVEEEEGYVSISEYEGNGLYSVKNLGPGSIKKYKIVITNNTDVEVNMSIVLSNIETTIQDFYDYAYVGVFSTKGFDFPYVAPTTSDLNFKENIKINDENGVGTINFVDNFVVPGKKSTVEIRFYIRIGVEAGNEIQSQSLTINTINFLCV